MEKPAPSDFGLRDQDIERAVKLDSRLPMVVFCLSGAAFFVYYMAGGEPTLQPLVLFMGLLVSITAGFLITLAAFLPIQYMLRAILPGYHKAKKFEKAMEMYKTWQRKTPK